MASNTILSLGGGSSAVAIPLERTTHIPSAYLIQPGTEQGGPGGDYSSTDFDADFAEKDTDDLTQGTTNRYWSQSLFDTAYAAKSPFDGDYDSLSNLPTLFDGAYSSLSGIPSSFVPSAHSQAWSTITGTPTTISGYGITDAFDGDYDSLSNLPTLGTAAAQDTTAFATAVQGTKADTALQAADVVDKADLVGGVIPTSQIPAIAIQEFLGVVADEAAMLNLTGQNGDYCRRTDQDGRVYVLITTGGSNLSDWQDFGYPNAAVNSINGQTGDVTLGKGDIGLGNVDNTSDADKPVSTAQQLALNGKEPTITAGTSAQYIRADKVVADLNKAAVGLPDVPNVDATDPDNLQAAAEIIALLKTADRAAFRDLLGYSLGDTYGYQILKKTDTQVSTGVASQAAVSVTGWETIAGVAATPSHTPLASGDLIVVRFTAGIVAHDEGVVNTGIAVEIGGTLIAGDAADSRTRVGSGGIIVPANNALSLPMTTVGSVVATSVSAIAVAAKLINASDAGGRTLYLNRTQSDLSTSRYAERGVSTLEIWGVKQ